MIKLSLAMAVFLVLPILLGIALKIEILRGDRIWEEAQAELAADGETHVLSEVLRPEPPDAENFAAISLIDALQNSSEIDGTDVFVDEVNRDRFLALEIPRYIKGDKRPSFGNWQRARPIDFEAWRAYLNQTDHLTLDDNTPTPAAIVTALSHFDPEWNELTAALDRPESQLKNYQSLDNYLDVITNYLPGYNPITHANATLSLRAISALSDDHPSVARESIAINIQTIKAATNQRWLISGLIEITGLAITLNPIWHGLEGGHWRDEDLNWIDSELAQFNLYEDGANSFRTELASVGGLLPDAFPYPWINHNAATIVRTIHRDSINPFKNRAARAICLQALNPAPDLLEFKRMTPYNFIAKISLPVYSGISKRFVQTQAFIDLARIACRLELHQRRTGTYPDSLTALPADTPIDLITSEPYHYARTSDGRYKLWSIGLNVINDHGIISLGNSDRIDFDEGDLVWAYRPEDLLPSE